MTPTERFTQLLRELFQFDAVDLDFGIYRILNLRRSALEKFIDDQLITGVEERLNEGALGRRAQSAAALAATRETVLGSLGAEALEPDGTLKDAYKDTPVGKQYLEVRTEAAGALDIDGLRTTVFNHLYSFFSRYYLGGDFISKRRYSQREKYIVPYNGEEVLLHWANADQYYVKSTDLFPTYKFRFRETSCVFVVRRAGVARDNNKDDDLFFFPLPRETEFDDSSNTVQIAFERRPISDSDVVTRRTKGAQEAILRAALEPLGKQIRKRDKEAYLALFDERHKAADGPVITQLEHHLSRFVARNAFDFFVHKELAAYLQRELDFYLKNEVVRLDELMEGVHPDYWAANLELLYVVRSAGLDIIRFLGQLEDFQRILFEKRKLVTEAHYCIAASELPEAFVGDVFDCDAQWSEWIELVGIDASHPDVSSQDEAKRRAARKKLLADNPTLLIDTRHFSAEQVDHLLTAFDDLDGRTDGLLVQGENFQALNLLARRFRKQVSAVYVDPPYNTSGSEILYKNSYKHSSWLTLMENRLTASRRLLADDAVQCTTIDDAESPYLHALLERVFGRDNYLATAVIRSKPQGRAVPSGFSPNHEYGIFYSVSDDGEVGRLPRGERQLRRYRERDEKGIFSWANFRKTGSDSRRHERPKSFYPVYVSDAGTITIPDLEWNAETDSWKVVEEPEGVAVWPIDEDKEERVWTLGWVRAKRDAPDELEARRDDDDGEWQIYRKYRPHQAGALPGTWWDSPKYSASESGTKVLNDILGRNPFSYPKSVFAVEDCLRACDAREDDIVLDYFAGSGTTGHAVINLNRDDGGHRRFILVEMGDHFDTVLLPRIKKVVFTPEWRDGTPARPANENEIAATPRIIKYIRLESYDDVLNSVELRAAPEELYLQPDFILDYLLDFESRNTPVRLGEETLARPFDVKLRVASGSAPREVTPDLPETFAYLLGMHVETRSVRHDDTRKYVVHTGVVGDRPAVIVWRDVLGWKREDYERDRTFIEEAGLVKHGADVYANGDSLIPNAQPLDRLFRERLFEQA